MDVKGLFNDLFTIEVNTIVKDDIQGTKMPSFPFALHEILRTFSNQLDDYGIGLAPYFAEHADRLAERLTEEGGAVASLYGEALAAYTQANKGRAPQTEVERRDVFNYLTDLWPLLEQPSSPARTERFQTIDVRNGWDSFERIRIAANQALDSRKQEFDSADVATLERIVSSCSRLKFIVQGIQRRGEFSETWAKLIPKTINELLMSDVHGEGVPVHTLRTEHHATVRKIWELGTERIVMQTAIQLDGDVVTRISPELLERHNEAVRARIVAAHRESTETSLKYWKQLLDVAERLVGGLLRR